MLNQEQVTKGWTKCQLRRCRFQVCNPGMRAEMTVIAPCLQQPQDAISRLRKKLLASGKVKANVDYMARHRLEDSEQILGRPQNLQQQLDANEDTASCGGCMLRIYNFKFCPG